MQILSRFARTGGCFNLQWLGGYGVCGALSAFVRLCFAACLLSALLIFASVRAEAQTELKTRIDTLAKDIAAAALPAPDADLKKSLLDLRAAISVLEDKAQDDPFYFGKRVDEILPIAGRLTRENGPAPTLPLADKANALIGAVKKLELADPTRAAITHADILSKLLPDAISTYSGLRSSVSALFVPLDKVEEVDFLGAVKRRSASLTGLLTTAETLGSQTSLDAITALRALDTKIIAYRKNADPMVDIVYAEYGDLRSRSSTRGARAQLCDATDKLRATCQAGQVCVLPDPASLCGRNPGEFIPAAHKGVRIQFRCMDPQLKVYTAPALSGMITTGGNSNWVVLRAAGDKFSCVPARPS